MNPKINSESSPTNPKRTYMLSPESRQRLGNNIFDSPQTTRTFPELETFIFIGDGSVRTKRKNALKNARKNARKKQKIIKDPDYQPSFSQRIREAKVSIHTEIFAKRMLKQEIAKPLSQLLYEVEVEARRKTAARMAAKRTHKGSS